MGAEGAAQELSGGVWADDRRWGVPGNCAERGALARGAAWWREWTEYSPTLTPDTVLTEGEWRGQTAQTALSDSAFTRWLYRLPHTSGEARGLLKLLLKTEMASVDRRRVAQRRWRLVLWSIRLRNALWAASERGSVARAVYVDPQVEHFRADCMVLLAR